MNKNVLLIILGILFIVLCVRSFQRSTDTDFESTYNTATRIIEHQPLYNLQEGMHGLMWSPFYATLVTPLGIFAPKFASLLFFIISFGATILGFYLLFKMFRLELPFMIVAVSLSARFLLDNFMYGQINTFILLNLVLFLYFSHKNIDEKKKTSKIKYMLSNIFIVFAASIKVFPAIFSILYIPKRIKHCIAGLGIGIFIIYILPALFLGFEETFDMYLNWYYMLSSSFERMPLDHYGNQSITATFTRLFGYSVIVIKISIYISLIAGLTIVFFSLKKPLLKKISLFTIASIIISPIVWKHTLCLLVIPNIFIAYRLQKYKLDELKKAKGMFLMLYVLFSTFTANGFIGNTLGTMAMNYSLILLSVVSLTTYIFLTNEAH